MKFSLNHDRHAANSRLRSLPERFANAASLNQRSRHEGDPQRVGPPPLHLLQPDVRMDEVELASQRFGAGASGAEEIERTDVVRARVDSIRGPCREAHVYLVGDTRSLHQPNV